MPEGYYTSAEHSSQLAPPSGSLSDAIHASQRNHCFARLYTVSLLETLTLGTLAISTHCGSTRHHALIGLEPTLHAGLQEGADAMWTGRSESRVEAEVDSSE